MESVIKWIKLKEKRPENGWHVLVILITSTDNTFFSSTAEAVYYNGNFYDPVEEYAKYRGVAAWAPMPEVKEEWIKDLL